MATILVTGKLWFKPLMVLFHGFPSASHMFRDLMPMLEEDFHLIAPDYPGFGQSGMPLRTEFAYTFDHLAEVMEDSLEVVGAKKFYMYVFDYGAPIGFRIAMKHPEKVLGIISQNGNVYEEGLGKKWAAREEYWKNPTRELRQQYKSVFAPETIIGQYTFGTAEGSVAPNGYTLDIFYTQREDYDEIQSDLILDYQNNVKLYPKVQAEGFFQADFTDSTIAGANGKERDIVVVHGRVVVDPWGNVLLDLHLHAEFPQEGCIPGWAAVGTDAHGILDGVALVNEALADIGVDIRLVFLAGEGLPSIVRIEVHEQPPALQYPLPLAICLHGIGQGPGQVAADHHIKGAIREIRFLGIHLQELCPCAAGQGIEFRLV